VVDEIDLTSSFNFFTISDTTSNSNLDKKELHQTNYILMIVKIIREHGIRDKNKKSGGGED
jgi:hypothetical protein